MNRPYIAENTRERKRLRALVAQMTDEELNFPLTESWTIASAFAIFRIS